MTQKLNPHTHHYQEIIVPNPMPTSSNPLIPWMWDSSPNRTSTNTKETKEKDDESWDEVRAFKDDIGSTAGTTWPPRCYTCSFCSRDFGSAQALGGHMNVHRRDRAMIRLQKQQEELLFCSMKRYQYSFDSNGYYVVDGNELAGYNTVPCFMSTPGTELLQRRSEAVVSQNICTEDGCSGNSLLMNSVTHGKFGDAVCVESDDDDDDDKSLKKLETCVMSSNLLLHQEQNGEREAKDLTTYKDFHSSRKGTEGAQERIDLELRLGSN